jgi:hypothetical protein
MGRGERGINGRGNKEHYSLLFLYITN